MITNLSAVVWVATFLGHPVLNPFQLLQLAFDFAFVSMVNVLPIVSAHLFPVPYENFKVSWTLP